MAEKLDFEAICRTCLGKDKLNPIFLNLEKSMRYSISLFMIAGLKVEMNDGLPQNMCIHCINSLNTAMMFRKQCKDAESHLLQVKSELETPDLEEPHNLNDKPERNENESELSVELKEGIDIKDETLEFDINHDFDDERPLTHSINHVKGLKRKLKSEKKGSLKEKVKTKRVNCNICQKELSIRSIDRHMESCHPTVAQSREQCAYCDSRVTAEKMRRHLRIMHGAGVLTCRYCGTEFEDQQALVGHVTTCTAKKKRKPYKKGRELAECELCHKVMQRASLRLHKAVKHKGLGPICEHCGKKFGNSIRLNEHYRAKHGYEKFKCGHCEYQTASELALKNHERRHRGEKPFVCEACGARFHAAYLLAQHRHSHRPDRRYKCDQCPASFKANNNLLMHKQSCHSTRIYTCLLCSRTYRWRHYAMKHLRAVHRFQGPRPPVAEVKNLSLEKNLFETSLTVETKLSKANLSNETKLSRANLTVETNVSEEAILEDKMGCIINKYDVSK